MKKENFIPSVNYHLWEPCNMRCKFCFATFLDVKRSILPKGHLPKEKAIEIVKQIAQHGFEKITFAGGEPTLCPWLSDLIRTAKTMGMTTMIVTNGSQLNQSFLKKNKPFLDWVTLSIDSLDENTNLVTGRAISGKKAYNKSHYLDLIIKIKQHGFGVKINTVINRTNYMENMSDFILNAQPQRWKVLQVLPIAGQNDNKVDSLIINQANFNHFIDCHQIVSKTIPLISESNDVMKGSYVMIDPAGRFFDNATGCYQYSKPILEIGVAQALKFVNLSFDKFIARAGIYDWTNNQK